MNLLFSSDKAQELSETKRNLTSALQNLAEARKQNKELTDEKHQKEQENTNLKEKHAALCQELDVRKDELRACKDDLFRLQPTSHIPDSKVVAQFESLVQEVSTWIDAEVSNYSDEWLRHHPGVTPTLFYHGGNQYVQRLLAHYADTAGEHLVGCMIHRQLYKYLFSDEIYLFGFGTDSTVFKVIEREMKLLQPPRGRWRHFIC